MLEHKKFQLEKFCKAFPSDWCVRNLMYEKSAECTVVTADEFEGQQAFLSNDKANSKGVEHLAKLLSYFNSNTGEVVIRLLDIDATNDNGVDIAQAIAKSLKRVRCPDKFLIHGVSTDSGGAGTADTGAKNLTVLLVTIPDPLVSCCTIHCLQLQLGNPIMKWFGSGGVKKKNVMQMLHCIWDVQKNLSTAEFQEYASEKVSQATFP